MIGWLVSLLLKPLTALGERYLQNQNDRDKLAAAVTQTSYNADASVRSVKLSYVLGRLPLFVAEMACSLYLAAILVDSTWPMAWLTPLELPSWFKPHFYMMCASIFGLGTFERVVGGRK